MRPTRKLGRAALKRLHIRSCTGWGLPGRRVTTAPVRSYRTISPLQPDEPACCVISVALSLGFPPLDVIQHPALWCPDFPRAKPAGLTRGYPGCGGVYQAGFQRAERRHSDRLDSPSDRQLWAARGHRRTTSRFPGSGRASQSGTRDLMSRRHRIERRLHFLADGNCAMGQRVWNRQPLGGSIGLGTSPSQDDAAAAALLLRVRHRRGRNSDCVYG